MFRLLGAETRHRILELLHEGPLTVGEIARRAGVTQPAVSQHLAVLRSAGLVRDTRKGQHVYYELESEAFARYRLGSNAFGWPAQDELPMAQLEAYQQFLRAELERVEQTMKQRDKKE
ncbi:hypothetical protein CH330_04685 [candidate division WOR-3 bacterium JGI_Cruoil_03_51_56]|uniref:HTH arsR-type domain-containing protein n=1 Tax=candidate division WOR-3 bacterium JGI_Cruoil_03_51_56 TaxID=1973747 RepID=A0A235BU24_UNCW3|nr:MAG: hypothetical protein CH330_04685 [candidate division WOR-3 bacterium JGI_Cruoil_03_51_56]